MSDHQQFMQRAIELAQNGRFTTTPNPNVGCVIVNADGKVVGEGWHHKAGEPHAEVHALQQAGDNAKGATCYVTLEPCSHYGRTPPCADRLIEAGVAAVVCAMEDPHTKVAGKGFKKLRDAGISVTVGVLNSEANAINPRFLTVMREKRAFIQVKLAASLDGKTALSNGDSQWITGPEARKDVQDYRAQACAIVSSAQTVIADNASLNVRWQQSIALQNTIEANQVRQPTRVIIDTKQRLNAYLLADSPQLNLFQIESPIILVRTSSSSDADKQQWPAHVSELIVNSTDEQKADLRQLSTVLFKQDLHHLWVEAGAGLAGGFIEAGIADELILYQAPKLIGDKGQPLLQLKEAATMREVSKHRIQSLTHIGEDIKLVMPLRKLNEKTASHSSAQSQPLTHSNDD